MDRWLVVVHVVAAIAWLGPSLGAGYLYRMACREGHAAAALRWFERVTRVEHVALAALLASGAGLWAQWGFPMPSGWLKWKLLLIGAVIVPIEAADIVVSHVWLPRALAAQEAESVRHRFERWLWCAGVPILTAAGLVLALAVLKPPR